jgi:predicted glycosyltransferase
MNFNTVQNKKILLSSLNWGMGHLARCIGLINELLERKNKITFAGNTQQINVIHTYFPDIRCIKMEGYPFDFDENKSFAKSIWKKKWALFQFVNTEQKFVNNLLKHEQFDLLISDHRYGFRSSKCISIFITHQYNLPLNGFQFLFSIIHRYWIKQFDKIWIMDQFPENLAGKLSQANLNDNTEYIGWHSRFKKNKNERNPNNTSNHLSILLLSGPDLHHNLLYEYFIQNRDETAIPLIIGSQKAIDKLTHNNTQIDMLVADDWLKIDQLIINAHEIFSFFGYSTLMDSQYLRANFHLIPCPTQLEQIYLSKIHCKMRKQ